MPGFTRFDTSGYNFKEKGLYSQAALCFRHANEEDLVTECEAFHHTQLAQQGLSASENFATAASLFEQVGKMTRIVNIEDISLTTIENTEQGTRVQAVCNATTFKYLKKQKKKKRARKKKRKGRKK